MKTNFKFSYLMVVLLILSDLATIAQKTKFYGKWNFDAPDAPAGFQIGTMSITPDSVISKYPGDPRLLPSSFYSLKNDTLTFVFTPAPNVKIRLSSKNETTLTGDASWDGGYSLITLTKMLSTIEQNKAIAQNFIDLWSDHDSIKFASLFAKEFSYRDMAFGLESTTKEKLISFIHGTIKAVPDFKLAQISIIANDSMAMVEWIWTGTYLGGWGQNYPGNDKPFKIKGVSVMVIENGLIKRNFDYYDKEPFRKKI